MPYAGMWQLGTLPVTSSQRPPNKEMKMKPHYFEQATADTDDAMLAMAKMQGYVPNDCLLGGVVVMSEINKGINPCLGCNGPRQKCGGIAKAPNKEAT